MNDIDLSVISFSFKNAFRDQRMDLFSWMDTCVELGIKGLDPWAAHFAKLKDPAKQLFTGTNPGQAEVVLDAEDHGFLDEVRRAAEQRGLIFGCLAADGPSYIYEPEAWKREQTRRLGERWIDAAARLRCRHIRIDPGQWHHPDVPDEVMTVIVDGYRHLIDYASPRGVKVLIENHWGCSAYPSVVFDILDRVEGLGLLFDTNNWAFGTQAQGWLAAAARADALHIKCRYWADDGEELTQHVGHAIGLLKKAGYAGMWGIESAPVDGTDEIEGVRRTIALIRKYLSE